MPPTQPTAAETHPPRGTKPRNTNILLTLATFLIAALLAALPVGLGVSVSGQSEAPLDPMGASRWTGTWTYTSSSGGVETQGDGYLDFQWTRHGVVAATDPRIAGDWTQNHLLRTYRDASGDDVGIGAANRLGRAQLLFSAAHG